MLRHLVFSHVPCSSSGPAACAAFPAAGYLGVFWSPGVCPSASLVTSVGLQPFPSFSVLLLLRLLAGVGWVLHRVKVLQLRWCLLGLTVWSPCCPSLTLGWVCFWPTVSQTFVGCPSWFVILFLCLLSFTFSEVGVGWSQVCGPSCDSWVLNSSDAQLRRPDALASGRTLSFCHSGFLPWAFVRTWVSRPRPCLGSYLLLATLPFLCPGFRLATLAVGWSRHLLFSWALPWVLPSRFQCWPLA